MVDAATHAVDSHPHWKKQFQYLEGRIGRSKAIVAIARKLLVVVWHVLMKQEADRFANPEQVAVSFFNHIYRVKVRNLPGRPSAREYTRQQLDRLGIGADMQKFRWGSKMVTLPPSRLKK